MGCFPFLLFRSGDLHGHRGESASLVRMNDVFLRGFRGGLLQLGHKFQSFGLLSFLDQGLQLLGEGFDVDFLTQIPRRAALVLAKVFDGGVLIRHRSG